MNSPASLNLLLVFSYVVAILVEVVAPFALALFLALRFGCRWKYWAIGLLVFLIFQVLTRSPVMFALQAWPAFQVPWIGWLYVLFASITAGLFEEGGRWLAMRFLIAPAERTWKSAVMLGAGHGGMESLFLSLLVLSALLNYLIFTAAPHLAPVDEATHAQVRELFAGMTGWEPLLGAWERLAVLIIQLALTVMVLQAFLRGQRWWWYALLAHTLLNFTSVALLKILSLHPFGAAWAPLVTEAYVGLIAVAAFTYLRRTYRDPRSNPLPGAVPQQAG